MQQTLTCPTGNVTVHLMFLLLSLFSSSVTSYSQSVSFPLDLPSYPPYLKDLIHSQLCQHLGLRGPCCESGGGGREGSGSGSGSGEPSPTAGSPDTLCSSLCSLDEQHPLLRDLSGHRGTHSHSSAAELAAKILSALQGGEELLARLQRAGQSGPGGGDCSFHSLNGRGRGIRPCGCQDSPCYSMSYSETYLSPGEDDDTPCKDYESTVGQVEADGSGLEFPPNYDPRRRVSDVASSGVVSLDEEDEEEEDRAGEQNHQWLFSSHLSVLSLRALLRVFFFATTFPPHHGIWKVWTTVHVGFFFLVWLKCKSCVLALLAALQLLFSNS